jgi:hypothetical protein
MLAAVGQARVTGSALDGIAEQHGARDSISTALFFHQPGSVHLRSEGTLRLTFHAPDSHACFSSRF